MSADLHLAVVGAGPCGLALALLAARELPRARITVFDARPPGHDVAADPRTLALSLGSVQLLQRLKVWPAAAVEPIRRVHVSQQQPLLLAPRQPEVVIDALEEGVPLLGAVLRYGSLVAPLQQAWQQACA
ncbi:NAD(P)-binding protein, partial [Caldimonas sp.]|uniref:NAD(P)-binding protein n=1 Tax=Caldimonas sp. TaxID=2838790 RepID=UPI003919CD9A